MHMKRPLILLTILLWCSIGRAADHAWHWVKAENNTDDWRVLQGTAEVSVAGHTFRANLFPNGSKHVAIKLVGNIEGQRITATEFVEGTDGRAATYRGRLLKSTWKETQGVTGVETITLTDGWSTIGLTRARTK
jgi:hypothetical protein